MNSFFSITGPITHFHSNERDRFEIREKSKRNEIYTLQITYLLKGFSDFTITTNRFLNNLHVLQPDTSYK